MISSRSGPGPGARPARPRHGTRRRPPAARETPRARVTSRQWPRGSNRVRRAAPRLGDARRGRLGGALEPFDRVRDVILLVVQAAEQRRRLEAIHRRARRRPQRADRLLDHAHLEVGLRRAPDTPPRRWRRSASTPPMRKSLNTASRFWAAAGGGAAALQLGQHVGQVDVLPFSSASTSVRSTSEVPALLPAVASESGCGRRGFSGMSGSTAARPQRDVGLGRARLGDSARVPPRVGSGSGAAVSTMRRFGIAERLRRHERIGGDERPLAAQSLGDQRVGIGHVEQRPARGGTDRCARAPTARGRRGPRR